MHWSAPPTITYYDSIALIHASCRTTEVVAQAEIDRETKLLNAKLDVEAKKAAAAAERAKTEFEFETKQLELRQEFEIKQLERDIKLRRDKMQQEKKLMHMRMELYAVHSTSDRRDRANLMPMACCVREQEQKEHDEWMAKTKPSLTITSTGEPTGSATPMAAPTAEMQAAETPNAANKLGRDGRALQQLASANTLLAATGSSV